MSRKCILTHVNKRGVTKCVFVECYVFCKYCMKRHHVKSDLELCKYTYTAILTFFYFLMLHEIGTYVHLPEYEGCLMTPMIKNIEL